MFTPHQLGSQIEEIIKTQNKLADTEYILPGNTSLEKDPYKPTIALVIGLSGSGKTTIAGNLDGTEREESKPQQQESADLIHTKNI